VSAPRAVRGSRYNPNITPYKSLCLFDSVEIVSTKGRERKFRVSGSGHKRILDPARSDGWVAYFSNPKKKKSGFQYICAYSVPNKWPQRYLD
jgi:hypothetical protein